MIVVVEPRLSDIIGCETLFDGNFAASILAGIRAVAKDNPGLQHN